MKKIPLNKGEFALADDEDYELIAKYSWHVFKPYNTAYAVRKGRKGEPRTVRMHRQILNVLPGMTIDHINGNGLDNRKVNLRICTNSLNQGNMLSQNCKKTSRYKGVSYKSENHLWVAQIQYQKRKYHLGYFNTEEAAAIAYNRAALDFFGDFARLNSIKKVAV